MPAVALAAILCLWGLVEQKSGLIASLMRMLAEMFPSEVLAEPRDYRLVVWTLGYHYFLQIELRLSMIVVLLVGPALISQDLRFNALPLYFSRPLRRIDYFLGKLGVIGWFLGLVVILPSLIAYVLGLLFSLDLATVWDTFPLLLASLAYGAVIVLSAGSLMLALSSLTRNSRYVALFWLGLWLISSIVAGILDEAERDQRHHALGRKIMAEHPSRKPPEKPLTREEELAQQCAWAGVFLQSTPGNAGGGVPGLQDQLEAAGVLHRQPVAHRQQLLGTDGAWRKLSEVMPAELRDEVLRNTLGPQYPWYWSAGVLVALFGLSAWILNFRVRSLDRLK